MALVAERFDIERFMKPLDERLGIATGEPETKWSGMRTEWRPAATAATGLVRAMLPLLTIGVVIGVAMTSFISPDAASRFSLLGDWVTIPAAAAFGTPLYFNTELFVPIADGLRSAGIGIGAIVALTIAGAGANVPEFVILSKLASRRVLAVFGSYIFVVAIVGGFLTESLTA